MAAVTRRNTRSGTKREKKSPTQDLPPLKSQAFKKFRQDNMNKKTSPVKEQLLWGARALAYREKYGRSFGTDSEGEMSESTEAAKLLRNLKIPKKGSVEPGSVPQEGEPNSPLERIAASEKPKTTEDLFDAIMGAFKLTNNNILATKTHLQSQVDNVASGVRTNTRAILKGRKELLAVSDRVLDLERRSLGNSILVFDHGMGMAQLRSWQEREKTILILLRQALDIGENMDYLFKIIRTEVRLPRIQGPGVRPPPIKVIFPTTAAYDYLATVVQYPTRLREWHRDPKGIRGSLPRFSVKPNVTFLDRQRAQYARKVIENVLAQGVPEGTRYESTPYGGIRKIEDGQARIASFERMLEIYANFLPMEKEAPEGHKSPHKQGGETEQGHLEEPGECSNAVAHTQNQGSKFQQAEEEVEESYMSSEN